MTKLLGKFFFGSIFIVVLPLCLVLWAIGTSCILNLPLPKNDLITYSLLTLGVLFILIGMVNLWHFGKGLPMNAYPPKYYVKKGIYSLFNNPIYIGCGLLVFGISLYFNSISGFWFISPYFCLMMFAYTIGFENEQTKLNFSESKFNSLISFHQNLEVPNTLNRIKVFLIVFIPWFIFYEIFIFLGSNENAIPTNLYLDNLIPLIEISIIPYILTYVFALFIPFIIKSKHFLFEFLIDVWVAIVITTLIYFLFPFIVNQKEILISNIWSELILWDRSYDGVAAALPSYHVIWGLFIYKFYNLTYPKFSILWLILCIFIILSCLTTGNHTLLDVLAGIIIYLIAVNRNYIWDKIRKFNELIANNWIEFNIGDYRLIYHGVYPAISVFLGIWLINNLLGKNYYLPIFIVGISGILGAALWAQIIEGSSKLQRPYGYYGSVIGVVLSSFVVTLFWEVDLWHLVAAFAIGACIMQSIGRLRCLVQGCCHGKVTTELIGIKYSNLNSRVLNISNLGNKYLHPTQTYSIISNVICFLILIKFYVLEMPSTFIIGNYFLINGLSRFIEESFRGETQTKYYFKMRLYQWIAIINIVIGAFFTTIFSNPINTTEFQIDGIYWALVLGFISLFAYGFDKPNSQKRFSKLTSD